MVGGGGGELLKFHDVLFRLAVAVTALDIYHTGTDIEIAFCDRSVYLLCFDDP